MDRRPHDSLVKFGSKARAGRIHKSLVSSVHEEALRAWAEGIERLASNRSLNRHNNLLVDTIVEIRVSGEEKKASESLYSELTKRKTMKLNLIHLSVRNLNAAVVWFENVLVKKKCSQLLVGGRSAPN